MIDRHGGKRGANGPRRFLFQGILPLDRSRVLRDALAGITLAALAIPEVLGYTKIAGTPVITGLYTMLLPMVAFALFGSSRRLVVGADSATAAILASGLAGLAASGSAQYVALCGLLALMAAAILLLARLIRLGFLADFLSRTVLIGFLTGIGVQVACGEFAGMLGLPGKGKGTLGGLVYDLGHLGRINPYTLGTAVGVLLVILGSRRFSKKIPGPLLAVMGATAASWAFHLKSFGVATLGPIPSGIPPFGFPHVQLSTSLLLRLLPTAFSIFVVILTQSAATSRSYAARYNESFSENLDLFGLSMANLLAGLSGTFVVNGSPTKTEMVDGAGGRSQLAHLTASGVALLTLLFLTKPMQFMPEAALCAVVFLIGLALIDGKGMHRIYRERPAEFWVALITAVVVVFVGVEEGILLAMFLSLVSHTRHGYRPKNMLIVQTTPEEWVAKPVATRAHFLPGLLMYRFTHGMYYANTEVLTDEVTRLVSQTSPPIAWFCISAASVDDIDYSAAETLRTLYGLLKERGIRLVFSEVADEVYAQLKRSGITQLVGEDAFYPSAASVARAYRRTGAAPNAKS